MKYGEYLIPSVQIIDLKGRRAMITGAAAGIGRLWLYALPMPVLIVFCWT